MDHPRPSEAEIEILRVLWAHDACTVREVHAHISREREIGYTTTLKQMQRMLEKGLLVREPAGGKSHRYRSAVAQEALQERMLDRLVDNVFGASVSKLVMHALGRGKASEAEIEEIKKFLDQLDNQD